MVVRNTGGLDVVVSRIDNVAVYIIKELKKHNIIIHRYNSYSTDSVYLKLDYGAGNSIRISDHTGKEHLKYKYNIIPKGKNGWIKDKAFWRYYCDISKNENIDNLIDIIINDIISKKILVGTKLYNQKIIELKHTTKNETGFWQKCFEV